MAKVTQGANVGTDWPGMAIQPITSGIEVVKLEAVNAFVGDENPVYLDAKDMLGVNTIGSWHSDASLVIKNMTTQDNAGNARNTSEMTVLMGYTGNSDSHWDESDLSVYFDQDYLVSGVASSSTLELRLVNNFQLALNNTPLVAFTSVSFNVGATNVLVQITPAIRAALGPAAYALLDAAIEARLVALGITGVTVTTLPARQAFFTDDVGGFLAGTLAGTYLPIQVVSTGAILATGLTEIDNTTLNFNGLNTQTQISAITGLPVSININLEKVGLGGDGGELIVGSMFKNDNGGEWDYCDVGNGEDGGEGVEYRLDGGNQWSNLYAGKGIAQFDVTVFGDASKPSSLSGMQSTGNNLRTVNVKTDTALLGTSFAALTIGNSNTSGFEFLETRLAKINDPVDVITPLERNVNALKDVQTFDASAFKGNLTLFAGLSDEVTAKYMNLVDGSPVPAGDNVAFVYTGGSGNDYINLWLSDANLSDAGTTTREDFTLTINGGTGNDEIVTMIGCGSSGYNQYIDYNQEEWVFQPDNWYVNSKINGNLTINAGDGNDTVRTIGAGDWKINGGAGNDTIYADNSGNRAVYVFNAVAEFGGYDLDNLQSQAAASVSMVNAHLTVTFKGITSKVVIANSFGSLTNVTITDLHVNQAIKAAINLDPVLSKLLLAEDGPGRTLVVTSLIDGYEWDNQLDITFSDTALVGLQTTAIPALIVFAASPALSDGYLTTNIANNLQGSDSFESASDNIITGGTGNDVIVLGNTYDTWGGMLSASNDTVKYDAGAFGNDTVVNFSADQVTGVAEVATVTWAAMSAAGTQTVGGMTITSVGAETAANVAIVAGGGTVAGTTITTPPTLWTVATAVGATNVFTSTVATDVTDIVIEASAGGGGVPTETHIEGVTPIAFIYDDWFDFVGLGGDITTQTDLITFVATNKSIFVVAESGANDTAAEITTILNASAVDDGTASTHVYVAYDTVTNIADVYTVGDGVLADDTVVTLVGTIDLADTPWASLTIANFI